MLVDTADDFLKDASAHFGRVFISLVLQAIMERAALPEHQRRPTFLIVDEAASYFDSNIDDLLTAARKFRCGCLFAHQYLEQASWQLRSSLAANTAIKFASGVSVNDARQLAPDMRTTADFILSQKKLHFAAYIRHTTTTAVSIPVDAGRLEAEPTMDQASYQRMRQANAQKVSTPVKEGDAFTFSYNSSGDRGTADGLTHHEFRPQSEPYVEKETKAQRAYAQRHQVPPPQDRHRDSTHEDDGTSTSTDW